MSESIEWCDVCIRSYTYPCLSFVANFGRGYKCSHVPQTHCSITARVIHTPPGVKVALKQAFEAVSTSLGRTIASVFKRVWWIDAVLHNQITDSSALTDTTSWAFFGSDATRDELRDTEDIQWSQLRLRLLW